MKVILLSQKRICGVFQHRVVPFQTDFVTWFNEMLAEWLCGLKFLNSNVSDWKGKYLHIQIGY